MCELIFEQELDIVAMRCESDFKSLSSIFVMNLVEATSTGDPEMFYEASIENLKEGAKDIFKNILDSIKKFFSDALVFIETKSRQFDLNKKLDELKTTLARQRSIRDHGNILNKKYSYFDMAKYRKYYSDFINEYVSELTKGLNRDFSTIDEYTEWRTKMTEKLDKFNTVLKTDEKWRLQIGVANAIELTEKEVNNRKKNLDMVKNEGTDFIRKLESRYSRMEKLNPYSTKFNPIDGKLAALKNSFIGVVCGKILQCMQTIVKFVTKHTFLCVTGLLVILLAA